MNRRKFPPAEIRDFMFGDNILPENRLRAYRESLNGVHHAADADPMRPGEGEPILLHVTTAGEIPFERVRVFFTTDDSPPDSPSRQALDLAPAQVTWDGVDWQYVTHWEGELPPQPDDTMIRYRLGARVTGQDRWVFADNQASTLAEATDFALWVKDEPAAAWGQEAVIYHVFVDRFYPGEGRSWRPGAKLDEFFGGTLKGVTQKLDYLKDLGFNALWLSPFFVSPSHHGYDAVDLYTVEPRLGTNEDLYQLIEEAHRRGMRMILDFVANHWSNQHFTMVAAQKDPHSPYRDWYTWKRWPEEYEGFFGVPEMPKLNLKLGSPARQYLLDCAQFWLEKGFDGFRCDFAYGPPLDFWVDFRRRCKQTRPDAYLFGEVIHSAPAQAAFAGAFDGMIDFLLCEALRQTFGYQRWSLEKFDAFLEAHERYFAGLVDRLTILDNHDMNRFLFLAGDDKAKLKLGALVLYTLAGSPINYTGTEAGVTQEMPTHHDGHGYFEEARAPMKWGEEADGELIEYYKKLIHLRIAEKVLWWGERKTLSLEDQAGIYAYSRRLGERTLVIVLNTSQDERTVRLPWLGAGSPRDLLAGRPVEVEASGIRVVLPPQQGMILG